MFKKVNQFFQSANHQCDEYGKQIKQANGRVILPFTTAGVLTMAVILISRKYMFDIPLFLCTLAQFIYMLILFCLRGRLYAILPKHNVFFMYAIVSPLLLLSIVDGTFLLKNGVAVTFLLFIIAIPLVILDRPFRSIAYIVIHCSIFSICTIAAKPYETAGIDLLHILEFGTASIFMCMMHTKSRLNEIENYETLRYASEHHVLTGLKNRTGLENDLDHWKADNVFVMMADMDNFKLFNDMYGHQIGDAVIQAFGKAISSHYSSDSCYSYGGDEFLVIEHHMGVEECLKALVDARADLFKMKVGNRTFHPGFSVGYVFGRANERKELLDMVMNADMNLYQAKSSSTNSTIGGSYQAHRRENDQKVNDAVKAEYKDSLTSANNMQYFSIAAPAILENIMDQSKRPVIICFTIEGLRSYNQEFGFQSGDQLLQKTADILKKIWTNRTICRYSGHHFLILTYDENLENHIHYIRKEFAQAARSSSVDIRAGICPYGIEDDVNETVENAKFAEEQILEGNVYRYYDDELQNERSIRHYVLMNFERALEEDWIQISYQPILRLISGKTSDLEALARWRDPQKGVLMPGSFIEPLKEIGKIHVLDLKIIELALSNIKTELDHGFQPVPVSVNTAGQDYQECDMPFEIKKLLKAFQVPSYYLTIELSEEDFLERNELLCQEMIRLHDLGLEVWLDDYTGNISSLSLVESAGFNLLKLDMNRFSSFSKKETQHRILKDIADTISRIGLCMLAESVETKEQQELLREIGCARIQGFYYEEPLPLSLLSQRISDRKIPECESILERSYYDELDLVNIDHPFTDDMDERLQNIAAGVASAIVEHHDDRYEIIRCNESFLKMLKRAGLREEANATRNRFSFTFTDQFMKEAELAADTCQWRSFHDAFNGRLDVRMDLHVISIDEAFQRESYLLILGE